MVQNSEFMLADAADRLQEDYKRDPEKFANVTRDVTFKFRIVDGAVTCEVVETDTDRQDQYQPNFEGPIGGSTLQFDEIRENLLTRAQHSTLDVNDIERQYRDQSLKVGIKHYTDLLEDFDRRLPAPDCQHCGNQMPVHQSNIKSYTTRLGRITVRRNYRYCRGCNFGCYPFDIALGLQHATFTAGADSIISLAIGDISYEAAQRKINDLAGVNIPLSTLKRHAAKIYEELDQIEAEEPDQD